MPARNAAGIRPMRPMCPLAETISSQGLPAPLDSGEQPLCGDGATQPPRPLAEEVIHRQQRRRANCIHAMSTRSITQESSRVPPLANQPHASSPEGSEEATEDPTALAWPEKAAAPGCSSARTSERVYQPPQGASAGSSQTLRPMLSPGCHKRLKPGETDSHSYQRKRDHLDPVPTPVPSGFGPVPRGVSPPVSVDRPAISDPSPSLRLGTWWEGKRA